MPLNYNRSFVESTYPTIQTILKVMTIVSITLDVLIFKWRPLVHLCLLVENIHEALRVLVPSTNTAYKMNYILLSHIISWCSFYTNRGWQLIQSALFGFLSVFITFSFLLDEDTFLKFGGFFKLTLWITVYMAGSCSLAIILIYIAQLQVLLRKYMEQNAKLLDGMHEGLLILSKSSMKTLFFNKPAQALIRGALTHHQETLKQHQSNDEHSSDINEFLKPTLFTP